jgi:hypothetical protein
VGFIEEREGEERSPGKGERRSGASWPSMEEGTNGEKKRLS